MDAEFKKLLAGGKWAASGDRADPGSTNISPQLVRATGWPVSYSQADGNTPDRRRMNQQFRELTGAAFEVLHGIPQYDAEVDYPVSAFTSIQTHLYRAKVANGPGSSNVTNPSADTNEVVWERVTGSISLPEAPLEAVFDNSETNQLSLRWKNGRDGGERVKRYNFQYRSLDNPSWSSVASLDYAQTTITGLSSGQVIIARIQAVTDEGTSPWYTTAENAPNNRVTGRVPSGGNALGLYGEAGDGRVRLQWTPPISDGGFPVLRYRIQWRTGSVTFSSSDETTSASTTATITGLPNGTLHYFRVRAENREGGGAWSNIAEATPQADSQLAVQPTLLAPSTGRSGSTITANARWSNAANAPTATPTSAKWQSRQGTAGTWSNSSYRGLTGFTISNASASDVYQVRNLLVTPLGETAYSDPATVAAAVNKATAPSAPRNVRVNQGTRTSTSWQGTATWSTPSSNGGGVITSYEVRVVYSWTGSRSGNLGGSTHLWTLGASNPPASGGRVTFYVRAVNHLGYQGPWASASYSW